MSQFYARYIPPNSTAAPKESPKVSCLKRPSTSKPQQQPKKRKLEESAAGHDVLARYSSTESRRKNREREDASTPAAVHKGLKATSPEANAVEEQATGGAGEKQQKKKKKKKQNSGQGAVEVPNAEDEEQAGRHTKVLSKLSKAREKAQRRPGEDEKTEEKQAPVTDRVHPDRAVQMDLGPIPQPEVIEAVTAPPTYSTAPGWLRNPIAVDDDDRKPFGELGLHSKLLTNLQSQGRSIALPVQSTVLPLLVNKEMERRDDLCVAAATGSGKTFAYVLPILNSLQDRKRVRLRAVIVVPTRALVKQVLQTLEACSSGLDVRIGSAEGSKTMEEEQRQLVEEKLMYNPEEWKRRQEAPVDWSTFSLEEVVDRASQKDPLANVGYITEYFGKVNVLVTTPGRLVEHLNTTKGFNLDYVQWFVADEADRLLDESYHEWLDTVLPALKSQKATEPRDRILEYMRLDVPKRRVTKVLLSATMTSDISQLIGLELHNPKLVLMENAKVSKDVEAGDTVMPSTNAKYSLPVRLQESAIAFKDSDNKPLYLLELLNQHILKSSSRPHDVTMTNGTDEQALKGEDEPDASSSPTSSSDSEDTSDSDSASASLPSSLDTDTDSDNKSLSDSSSASSSASSTSSIPKSKLGKPSSPPKHQSLSVPLPRVLIFTKSTESAHRLSRLLSLLDPSLAPVTATFTRSSSTTSSTTNNTNAASTTPSSRSQQRTLKKILESFISGRTRILISTDLSSRGLDIPSLEHVVNYDVPASALTYVHRVGRTARAGLSGHAWTLVEHKQGKWFWETIAGKGKLEAGQKQTIGRTGKINRVEIKIGEEWKEKYEDALRQLGEDVRGV